MPDYSLAWNRRRLAWYKNSGSAPWQIECILLERISLEGRPQLRIVGRLGSILEDRTDGVSERESFWSSAQRKLGKLRRLSQSDIWQIEILIAARIPKPMPTACPPTVHRSANPIRGPHQPLRQALRAR